MNYLLLTTTTCPKCPEMKKFVQDNISFDGKILNENSEGFYTILTEYNLSVAPTFLVLKGDVEVFRASEIEEISNWLKK